MTPETAAVAAPRGRAPERAGGDGPMTSQRWGQGNDKSPGGDQ
jgi:hypothetical protein